MSTIEVQHIKSDGHLVAVGSHCLAELAEWFSKPDFANVKVFILVDENTLKHCCPLLINKIALFRDAEILEINSGEESKSTGIASRLWSALSELGADRSSALINLGGGVVSDLGGFVAGTFKRGIRFFNIPTSLLAQVDASIGGKTGINLDGLKNEVGLFKNPEAVFVDPAFLLTLPRKELLSGFAEMIKHALICDSDYWQQLQQVSFYDLSTLDDAVMRSIRIKNEIVNSDPFETGRRKLLNFGHTIGHAIESYSYESDARGLLHGEAVAMGMVCESFISYKKGLLAEAELRQISQFLFSHFTKISFTSIVHHRLIELMKHDKKNSGEQFNFSLLQGIGNAVYDEVAKADLIIDSLNYYSRWVG